VSEFAFEPVHGLPENLPPGEALRWQGAPHWRVLARRAFHARTVAFYFGLLILIQFAYLLLGGGAGLKEAVLAAFWLFLLGGLAVGILVLLAWLYSRSTVYSITDRRLVIRFGVALPMAVNIPFKIVESAGLRTYPDGSGDIPLVLGSGQKVSYLIMWPNVRPWRFSNAQPMLRAIPDAKNVAEILAEALQSATADTDTEADEAADPRSNGSTDTGELETAAAKAGGR
jgi:hypothetical protein